MSKFTTTLKGLMALALGSFALGADALPIISPEPVDGEFAEGTTWYTWQAMRGPSYVANVSGYTNTNGTFVRGNSTRPTADGGYWCFVGNETDGYTIYNKASGTSKVFGVPKAGGQAKLYDATEDLTNVATKFEIGECTSAFVGYHWITIKDFSTTQVATLNFGNPLGTWVFPISDGKRWMADAGSAFLFRTDEQIADALKDYKEPKIALLYNVKWFFHNPSIVQQAIYDVQAANTTDAVDALVENILDGLNNKVVYLTHNVRKSTGKPAYMAVGNDYTVNTVAEPCTYAKWKFERVGNTSNYRLLNIASGLYISQDGGISTANATNPQAFSFESFARDGREDGTRLHIPGTGALDGSNQFYGGQYLYFDDNNGNLGIDEEAKVDPLTDNYAFSIEPTSEADPREIQDGYYVIRCNRGLTGTTESGYNYPGTLLGVYTTDRKIARDNAGYLNGPHLQTYSFRSIWHIKRAEGTEGSNDGFKITSLIGEIAEGPMGLTLGAGVENQIKLTTEPTTIYIRPIDQWNLQNGTSLIPNAMVLSTVAYDDLDKNNCIELSNRALKLSDDRQSLISDPTCISGNYPILGNYSHPADNGQTIDLGTYFYIEKVSDADVETARAQFLNYVNGTRSFETLKGVLSAEEQLQALQGKTNKTPAVTTVAEGNAWLSEVNEDNKVSSTYAVEMLHGKLVRFNNRTDETSFISENDAHNLVGSTSGDALDCIWEVEVDDAPMREVKLRNYKTGRYLGACPASDTENFATVAAGKEKEGAAVYYLHRQPTIDFTKFYLSLRTYSNAEGSDKQKNTPMLAADGNIVRSAASLPASHWTMLNAVDNSVAATEIELTYDKENKIINISGATLEKTEGFNSEAHPVVLTPKSAETGIAAQAADVIVPTGNINKETGTNNYQVNLDGLDVTPANYKLSFPMGYFTVNSKLAPAMTADITVEPSTGIKEVNAAEKGAAEVIYDLQGRRVSKASKGVYIINGVKTLVK